MCELFLPMLIDILELLYLFGKFLAILQVGFGYASSSLHTHIVHIMSGALYPGLCNLELRGLCSSAIVDELPKWSL